MGAVRIEIGNGDIGILGDLPLDPHARLEKIRRAQVRVDLVNGWKGLASQ